MDKDRKVYNDVIQEVLAELGLPVWGVTDAESIRKYQGYYDRRPAEMVSAFESGLQEKRCHTAGNFIAIAFPYAHELVWGSSAAFSVYARGRDYHTVVRSFLDHIAGRIRDLGFRAEVFTDSNDLPERLIAALAGLGYLGRNSLLITREYGSYVFLGEIRTDLPLAIAKDHVPPGDYSLCGTCRRCLEACPPRILGPEYVATGRCLSALTQKKSLTLPDMKALKGRLFGCDTCQRVCPHNRDKADRGLEALKPFPWMVSPDLQELLTMTNEEFKERYRPTAAGWRGRPIVIRNAMIALAEREPLPEDLVFASPLLQTTHELLRSEKKRSREKTDF